MAWIASIISVSLVGIVALAAWRQFDRHADARAWDELAAGARTDPCTFEPTTVSELPEPARRYFNYMIEPGTPLYTVVELDMIGQIGLGTRQSPNYQAMTAHQILAPPHGLVWQLESGVISGSDGALPDQSWTRFWLRGLLPVVRVSDPDHHRSAFGRVAAEAAFWAPASLLPSDQVRWEAADANTARAVVSFGSFEQAVEIAVSETGAPTHVQIQRWSNANAEKEYREQPFGGELSEFRRFDGYRLPTCVEGGNGFGTPDYFPFFRVEITEIRFPRKRSSADA